MAATVGVAMVALAAAGCRQPSRADLHKAGRSLLPPSAAVVLEKDSACVEGARFPSCVEVYFRLAAHPRLGKRRDVFLANARRDGWKTKGYNSGDSEVVVRLSKGSYRGAAAFWVDRYYRPDRPHCGPVSTLQPCADHFFIQWKGGIISG
jgi:hypothetical protein